MPARETRAECYSEAKIIERNVKRKNIFQKLSRMLKRFFGRIAKRDKSAIFYNKLRRYLAPGSKILDIGCGDGSFLKLAKKDFVCAGIEISDHLASLARKDPEIKVITGNFISVDFSKEKYNGITMISLLEHLDDPLAALKICFEHLNAGGVLLLKTVNYGCLNRKIKKGRWTGFRPPDHMIYFDPVNLKSILQKAGFRKINISAWSFNDNMYCEAWR
ncbi:MAG: class I SAM-dependent methyltransferase [Candidatus Omnitrophota bacterium]|nr:class I SAM-dependent methyltransferase [Candidatus Omnitrophota bacterium]